jgi:hypothetical protein
MSREGRLREQDRLDAVRLKSTVDAAVPRCCAWPGCTAEGLHRAPVARDRLREYQFLCLEHVREFNQRWDYFAGMSATEIEAHNRSDVTWNRPSWRFGTAPGFEPDWHDAFGLFGEAARKPKPAARLLSKAERMMARLDLVDGFTLEELKSRFKTLAKRHHPDLNGGDKGAEERLRLIIEAYNYLRQEQLYI